MSTTADDRDATHVLTLEDLGNLTRESGNPAETLMNVVALIASRFHTDVCSAYLLEPDRATLVLAATVGLRPQCVGTLRMALHEGLAGLVAEDVRPVAVEQVRNHPRFKYFREAGEDDFQSFLGVPLIDRDVLQGVLIVQTREPRLFHDDEIRMLVKAAAQVAPVVSEARTLDRFIAPALERLWSLARNLWWSWDHDSTSLFRDLDPIRFKELNQNPISMLGEIPLDGVERRAQQLMLHGRINYAYRRQREYLAADRTWGAKHASAAGCLLFSGVWFARIDSDLLGRSGRARGRSRQERVGSGNSARRCRTALWPGLFSAAVGSQWLAAGGIPRDGSEQASDRNRHRSKRRACHCSNRNANRSDRRPSLEIEGRTLRCISSRFQRAWECA
jgi:putative methionine-R-sulfoxide reductase with GAF domain